MAGDKQPIIIKKKKGGGHAAHHGGSWKVAYADFVTAMMCFFLVMWLLGADEEIKAAIEHYFNNPNVPWKSKENVNPDAMPMGEREGQGDELLKGLAGTYPEDLINRPVRPFNGLIENESIAEQIKSLLEGEAYHLEANADFVRFALSDQVIFKPGSSELSPEAKKRLDKLAALFKEFSGYVRIEGHTDPSPGGERGPAAGKYTSHFEISFNRALNVMKYLVDTHNISEEKLLPAGMGTRKPIGESDGKTAIEKNGRVEFVMNLKRVSE